MEIEKHGVTIMHMNEKMDEGDIILQEKLEIGEYETTGELWDRLSKKGAEILVEAIRQIEKGTAKRIKQGNSFTIAPMIEKSEARIDFSKTAREIKNKVYGLNPFLGAYTIYKEKKIKFWKVEILDNKVASEILEKEITENILSRRNTFSRYKNGIICKSKRRCSKDIRNSRRKCKKDAYI